VAKQRRAIGADDLAGVSHVEEHMWVIEGRQFADTHEFPRADLDHRDTRRIVKVRNDRISHVVGLSAGFLPC